MIFFVIYLTKIVMLINSHEQDFNAGTVLLECVIYDIYSCGFIIKVSVV